MFRRRRRRGRVLVPVLVLSLGGAAASWVVLSREAAAGDAPDVLAIDASASEAAEDDPTASDEVTSEAPTEPDPVGSALRTVPAIEVDRQLDDERQALSDSQGRLRRQATRVVRSLAKSLDGAQISVAIRDPDGRRILDHGEVAGLLPASTMKAVTAATVLTVLGPDHRFTTTLASTGPIRDGVVHGDLVIVGGGDPVLSTNDYRTHVYPSRPSTSLEDLADAVVEAGITRVRGRVLADSNGWGGSDVAAGWRASYLDDQNARRITRLTVDAGLDVSVEVPDGAPVRVVLEGSPDPVIRTARMFAGLLKDRDVGVRRKAASSGARVETTSTIASVSSPPVSDLLRFTMERSDNHLADTMLRAAAYTASGDGSWAAAHRTAAAVLTGLGVDATGLRVADGSGLSRLDRLSAAQLADLDAAMMHGPAAAAWQDSLALTGREGTLKNRLRGTAGEARFYGKTGTLDDVKAVVGHVVGPENQEPRLHLAIVANGKPYGGISAVSVLMDRLQIVLVDHVDGCSTTWKDGVPTRSCLTE